MLMDESSESPWGGTDACTPADVIIEGVVYEQPGRWQGMHKVLWSPPTTAEMLADLPGVMRIEKSSRKNEIGIYLPHNLIYMGSRPGSLSEYDPDPIPTTPSGLPLEDYQRRYVTAIRSCTPEQGGLLVAADPGLGKTCMALQSSWLDGRLHKPGLILGPLGAQGTWCGVDEDAAQHYGLQVVPLEGSTPSLQALKSSPSGWYFIHYDVLNAWSSAIFSHLRPETLIIDEIHLLMNPEGQRYKAALAVSTAAHITRRIGLTGTPIPKTRMDLWAQLAIIQPNQWGPSKFRYGVRYAGGHQVAISEDKGVWVYDGMTNTDELRARLAGVYLRLTKSEALSSRPQRGRPRSAGELSPEVRQEYWEAKTNILKYREARGAGLEKVVFTSGGKQMTLFTESKEALQLVTTTTLKSILDKGKLPLAKAVIESIVPQHQHLGVFTWTREAAKQLFTELEDLVVNNPEFRGLSVFGPIDGTDQWQKRREEVHRFVTSDWSVLVATRGSLGVSINPLAKADACLQVTPDWNPDINIQLESRFHRRSSVAAEVHSYYMVCPKTLDDRIIECLKEKGEEAKALVGSDTAGLHLAAALDPTIGDENMTLDTLCDLLEEIDRSSL